MVRFFLLFFVIAFAMNLWSEDQIFRYVDGRCVDKQGKEGYNLHRFGQCADLRGVTLSGLDLSGVDWSGSRFDSANLELNKFNESVFVGVDFSGANLSGSELKSSKIENANFSKSRMVRVNLYDSAIKTSTFVDIDLSSTVLEGLRCESCEFRNVSFVGANLKEADFTGSKLGSSNFSKADLTDANLSGSDLSQSDFRESLLQRTKFSDSTLTGADFSFSTMIGLSFADEDMTGAVFYSSRIDRVTFDKVLLKAANFRYSNFSDVVFVDTDLSGASFRKTTMANEKLTFQRTNMESVDLRSSNLRPAKLDVVKLKGAIFNKKTKLPLTVRQRRAAGMVLAKDTVISVWAGSRSNVRETNNIIETLETFEDLRVKRQEANSVSFFKDAVRKSDIFIVPEGRRLENDFVDEVKSTVQEFVKGGGYLVMFRDNRRLLHRWDLIPAYGEIDSTSEGMYKVLIPKHPLSVGLGKTITANSITGFCVDCEKDEQVTMVVENGIVATKPYGEGLIVHIGYCYGRPNADSKQILFNLTEL